MKQFTLSALVLIASYCSFAQDKHQCAGTTKAGTQCKRMITETYCKQHDSTSLRCGEPTKTGGKCQRIPKQGATKCFQHPNKTALLYNAYSPSHEDYFVIKSNTPLKSKSVVWFNDNAEAVNYTTPYVATIISPYHGN
jgi:hypothetical protein